MSRPLNKKYFGNRNVGSASTTADDNIGGEGIASINWSALGAFRGNGTFGITGLALPAPTLPNGVQATWDLEFDVEGVSTGAGKLNLAVGDTFGHANLPGMIAKVTDTSGANAVFSVTTTGASRGNPLAYGDLMADTQGLTLTKIAGSGTAGTFLVDVNYRVSPTTSITEPGSGYTGAETFTAVVTGNGGGQVAPAGTIVKTASSNTNAAENPTGTNEDAIIAYAYVDGGREVVDIVAQKGSKRYIVQGASGTVNTAFLVADTASADGEMEIRATDSDGGTYWITKLTARLAVVEPDTGTQFASGARVKWNLSGAVEDVSVEVENA